MDGFKGRAGMGSARKVLILGGGFEWILGGGLGGGQSPLNFVRNHLPSVYQMFICLDANETKIKRPQRAAAHFPPDSN
ncbi:MAG: hypothetical protein C9356_14020 [Oleiphilus sp.]|nr:MAG: hypothetical protein C9356_14020 [Oleiphilus sp.]